jgi:hypothetical protein
MCPGSTPHSPASSSVSTLTPAQCFAPRGPWASCLTAYLTSRPPPHWSATAFCPTPFGDEALEASDRRNQVPQGGGRHARCVQVNASRATYFDLELLPQNQVCWHRQGWIDLGGIAKGYAVDRAVEVLRSQRVTSGIVNAVAAPATQRRHSLLAVRVSRCAARSGCARQASGRGCGGHPHSRIAVESAGGGSSLRFV